MRPWKALSILLVGIALAPADLSLQADSGGFDISLATSAQAEVGRPLTPGSYAGVARRTSRRVARRTAVRVNSLPPGCVYGRYYGAYYYRCGGMYYQRSGGVYVKVVIN